MYINEIFSNVEDKKITEIFFKYHIEVPEKFVFSNINIVIGTNGSGKTRFLQAIKELYMIDDSVDVIYGYFPSLSDHKLSTDESNIELPECTLYDAMYMDEMSFSDFFKEVEAHNEEFIPELLDYHSQRQKKLGDKALNIIFDSFFSLTGKELIIQEKKVFVKGSNDSLEPLSTMLNTFSPGELILFYMSIFLAFQQNGRKNKVIILDEPESHLHPKALISFMKLLTQAYQFKEIWIATHSLFLLPEFQFENTIYICDSIIIRRTSQMYLSILSNLLGDNDKIEMFFSLLFQWQYCEFIAECFMDPTVIDVVNPEDEQVQIFIHYLKIHKPFLVLDCGGGSGRLGLSLEAAQIEEDINIRYDIFDLNPTYNGDKFNVYTDLRDIKELYHCVVMMNFLHEVDPKEWIQLFLQIYGLMEDDSYLLFVEVAALSQGERPNDVGYLVLGKEELEILFQDSIGLFEIKYKEKQKSSCIVIPKRSLLNVTQKTILGAIKHLENRVLEEIKVLREDYETKKENTIAFNARKYAFLTQQYIIAKLFCDSEKKWLSEVKRLEVEDSQIKLNEIISFINQLNIEDIGTVSDTFNIAVRNYIYEGIISKEILAECWEYIFKLEMEHANKQSIASLIVVLALMGDIRAKNKINHVYRKYLPSNLQYIV